jgi:type II secretory pathway component GspD/PulD (secretin)
LIAACHVNDKINKRSIEELYNEAVAASAEQPQSIRPSFATPDPMATDRLAAAAPPAPGEAHLPWDADVRWQDAADQSGELSVDDAEYFRLSDGTTGTEPGVAPGALAGDSTLATDKGSRGESISDSEPSAGPMPAPMVARVPIGKTTPASVRPESIKALPEYSGPPFSDVFDQTDIREVVQILSEHFNVPIVIDDSVGGVVTAQLSGDSLDKALEKVLMPLGLVHAAHNGGYVVAPPDPDSPLFSYIAQRQTFQPAYHSVASLVALLPPRYVPFIQSSPQRNIVVIEAPGRIVDEVLSRLRELDSPVPQVELEVLVCVVSPDSGFKFGLDWGHVVGVQNADSLKVGMTGLAMSGSVSGQGLKDAFSDFAVTSAFMRLLAQEGYVTIRAAPRVTAKDGEKAQISLQRETFFSLQPDSTNVFFRQDVQKVEAGISLEITPRVHGDMVSVEIAKAEVSEDIRASGSSPDNPYPLINRRVVSTNVNVQDGHTIVIGGLVQRQTVERVNRVPGLSRIPLAGKLFQTVDKLEQDVEVAIFISPRIIQPETTNIECR